MARRAPSLRVPRNGERLVERVDVAWLHEFNALNGIVSEADLSDLSAWLNLPADRPLQGLIHAFHHVHHCQSHAALVFKQDVIDQFMDLTATAGRLRQACEDAAIYLTLARTLNKTGTRKNTDNQDQVSDDLGMIRGPVTQAPIYSAMLPTSRDPDHEVGCRVLQTLLLGAAFHWWQADDPASFNKRIARYGFAYRQLIRFEAEYPLTELAHRPADTDALDAWLTRIKQATRHRQEMYEAAKRLATLPAFCDEPWRDHDRHRGPIERRGGGGFREAAGRGACPVDEGMIVFPAAEPLVDLAGQAINVLWGQRLNETLTAADRTLGLAPHDHQDTSDVALFEDGDCRHQTACYTNGALAQRHRLQERAVALTQTRTSLDTVRLTQNELGWLLATAHEKIINQAANARFWLALVFCLATGRPPAALSSLKLVWQSPGPNRLNPDTGAIVWPYKQVLQQALGEDEQARYLPVEHYLTLQLPGPVVACLQAFRQVTNDERVHPFRPIGEAQWQAFLRDVGATYPHGGSIEPKAIESFWAGWAEYTLHNEVLARLLCEPEATSTRTTEYYTRVTHAEARDAYEQCWSALLAWLDPILTQNPGLVWLQHSPSLPELPDDGAAVGTRYQPRPEIITARLQTNADLGSLTTLHPPDPVQQHNRLTWALQDFLALSLASRGNQHSDTICIASDHPLAVINDKDNAHMGRTRLIPLYRSALNPLQQLGQLLMEHRSRVTAIYGQPTQPSHNQPKTQLARERNWGMTQSPIQYFEKVIPLDHQDAARPLINRVRCAPSAQAENFLTPDLQLKINFGRHTMRTGLAIELLLPDPYPNLVLGHSDWASHPMGRYSGLFLPAVFDRLRQAMDHLLQGWLPNEPLYQLG